MRRQCFIPVLLFVALGQAEVIDRVAATAGTQVITDGEVTRQTRIAAFLNREKPDLGGPSRRATAERVVEQLLIRREMRLSRYPQPESWEVDRMLKDIVSQRFPREGQLAEALRNYGLSEDELRRHLAVQLATLRFTEFRFRPSVQITDTEVQEYYAKNIASKPGPPPLTDARDRIRQILTEERVNLLLDRWLRDTRNQTRVEFREESFK